MAFQSSRLPRTITFFSLLCLLELCMTGWFARFGPDVKTAHGFFFLTSSAIAYAVLYMLPALILLAAFVVLVVFLVRRIRRRAKARKEKKLAAQAQAAPEQK